MKPFRMGPRRVTPAGRARPSLARRAWLAFAAALLVSACTTAVGQVRSTPLTSLGPTEGYLRLLAFGNYVADGNTDPRVDWVSLFQRRTGCRVSVTHVASADQIIKTFQLHNSDYYDGVVAPPAVAGQLISDGVAAPLNPGFIGGYTTISPLLRSQAAVTAHGHIYGMPFLWSSYVVGYGTQAVRPAPASWASLLDPAFAAKYKGRIMLPDTPLTIALAAFYLKSARPSLGITDPYELNAQQFAAATGLLKSLQQSITGYYSQDADVIAGLASGSAVLAAVLPRHVDTLARAGRKIAGADPAQGTTGSVTFWLMNSQAPHPNCMYQWLGWNISPRLQQQAAQWTGTAPVNPAACEGLGRAFCGLDHVGDQAYLSRVAFAHLPVPGCGNGRNDCMGWQKWTGAWASILRVAPG